MSFVRTAAALGAIAAVSFVSTRASAFCRTITAPLPADYNPSSGCYDPAGSIPLWWRNASVGWSVQRSASKQVSLADAKSHAALAFGKWSSASCTGGGSPSIKADYNGDVDCDQVEYSEAGPNQHSIIFRDDSWPHDDPYNTLALTTVTFDKDTGEIYDADMEVNTAQNNIVVNGPAPQDSFDFDSIVTHEAGHFLGLAHSPSTSAIMFARYKPGSTTLTNDDVDGICTIYAPDQTRATIQSDANGNVAPQTVAEGPDDPTPRHGFGTACGPVGDVTTTTKSGCSVAGAAGGAGGSGPLAWLGLGGVGAAFAARRRRGATLRGMRGRTMRAFAFAAAVAGATAGVSALAARDAQASVSIAVLFDDLVRDSSAAAIVTPMEQRSVWENGRIYTYTRAHVDRAVAGESLGEETWIRTSGGVVGKIGQIVEGEASLTPGRPTLLFVQRLDPASGGVYLVSARAQGQFPVVMGADKQLRVVHAYGTGVLMTPPSSRVATAQRTRAAQGLAPDAPLASDVLHQRAVDAAVAEIAAAWSRIHATPR
jgi:MYXO-CTERM domain-containing protein